MRLANRAGKTFANGTDVKINSVTDFESGLLCDEFFLTLVSRALSG
jgi:hypothetical protein